MLSLTPRLSEVLHTQSVKKPLQRFIVSHSSRKTAEAIIGPYCFLYTQLKQGVNEIEVRVPDQKAV
jgi:hypothetical protein